MTNQKELPISLSPFRREKREEERREKCEGHLSKMFDMSSEHDDDDEQYERNRGGRKQIKLGTTRRNTRERNRVKHLNQCFEVLRQHIPQEKHQKKLSKVDTLKSAMIYIENLQHILQNTSTPPSTSSSSLSSSASTSADYRHYLTNEKFYFPFHLKQEQEENEQQLHYWQSQHRSE